MKLKVLPLQRWQERILQLGAAHPEVREGYYQLNEGILLGRPGFYFDRSRNFCWVEGTKYWFEYLSSSFIYELNSLNHKPLREREFNLLKQFQTEIGRKIDSSILERFNWQYIQEYGGSELSRRLDVYKRLRHIRSK